MTESDLDQTASGSIVPHLTDPLEILYEAVNQLEDPYEWDSLDGTNGRRIAELLMKLEPVLKNLALKATEGVPSGG